MRAEGGEIYGIVSQKQEAADQARKTWGIKYPLIADPPCAIGTWMNEHNLANVEIDVPLAQSLQKMGVSKNGGDYEVGTYQPAVVALDNNCQLLFSWSSVPSPSNLHGAMGRPRSREAWKAVSTSLSGDMSLVNYTPPSVAKANFPLPMSLFFALLLANGNFIRWVRYSALQLMCVCRL